MPAPKSIRALEWLNFFVADVQTGLGPFLAAYLAANGWSPSRLGAFLTAAGLIPVALQIPSGALTDHLRNFRRFAAFSITFVGIGAALLCWRSNFPVVASAQALIVVAGLFTGLLLNAILLGITGPSGFDRQLGINQSFAAAGNVVSALLFAFVGYHYGNRYIFLCSALFVLPTLACLFSIRPADIDPAHARGAIDTPATRPRNNTASESLPSPNATAEKPAARASAVERIASTHAGNQPTARESTASPDSGKTSTSTASSDSILHVLLGDRVLLTFLLCAALFHLANAAMLPQLGEMLARGHARSAAPLMSACIIVTQLVITFGAAFVGRLAARRGRRNLLLVGFAALILRGALYTIVRGDAALIAVQLLDGLANVIFGVVSALVIADRTRGTGRFNLAQGALGTAVGIGAALSNTFGGLLIQHLSYNASFLGLAGVGALAFTVLLFAFPEILRPTTITPSPTPASS